MKQGSTMFLRGVVVLIGLTVLALCVLILYVAITSEELGAYRSVLLSLYLPAIPFYIALGRALKLLSSIDKNEAFSQVSVKALKNIKFCGIAISVLFAAGMPLIIRAADQDDAPGVVMIGLVIIFASLVIATFAALLQKLLKEALDIKKENELTV
ncbi:MAG: DUF2975 domain-containing protein [Candidatus Falkowbacteria bacterium]